MPAGQKLVVAAAAGQYAPTMQSKHEPWDVKGLYVPAAQLVGAADPLTQKAPAGQTWHAAADVCSVNPLYVPAAQCVGAPETAGQ